MHILCVIHIYHNFKALNIPLVGIVNLYNYVVDYNLHRFLGEDLAQECAYKYKFLGADQIFVKELLQHGYYHQGYKDCHEYFAKHHITLVFLQTE